MGIEFEVEFEVAWYITVNVVVTKSMLFQWNQGWTQRCYLQILFTLTSKI